MVVIELLIEDKAQGNGSFSNSEGKLITVHQQDIVPFALDLLTELVKHKTVTLVATGQSIPTAVAVANIVTENMMKGNSKILDIIVDSEETNEKSGPSLISVIKITIAKTN
jgi:archaea-specific DNA-binding protein